MKRNKVLLAALMAACPVALWAAAAATDTSPASGRGHGRQNAWYQHLDTNQDGALSKEEMLAAAQQRIDKMFATVDTNHDGLITQDEMRAAHAARAAAMKAKFDAHVKQADTNGDSLLSREEVQAGMPMLARRFDRLDRNHDGELSADELQPAERMMMGFHHGPHHGNGGPGADMPEDATQGEPAQTAPPQH